MNEKKNEKTSRPLGTKLALAALLALGLSTLTACGGGGAEGGGGSSGGAQGLRFSVASTYDRMVHSVDVTGPAGKQRVVLGLQPGQEMLTALPAGDYTLLFWIYAGNGFSVSDLHPRQATVYPSQVTVVPYP